MDPPRRGKKGAGTCWRAHLDTVIELLLCGGLVETIFLVVYFTLGLGSLMSWMFYVGLIITVADVLVALALTNYGGKTAAKTAALERSGVLALAQITRAQRDRGPGSTINRW